MTRRDVVAVAMNERQTGMTIESEMDTNIGPVQSSLWKADTITIDTQEIMGDVIKTAVGTAVGFGVTNFLIRPPRE